MRKCARLPIDPRKMICGRISASRPRWRQLIGTHCHVGKPTGSPHLRGREHLAAGTGRGSASSIRKPDALHLAIWAEGVLCGLVVGKPNANRSRLAIHYLEGTPQQNNPLRGKVVLVTLAAATRYAQALEIPLLRVRNPVLSMETWLKRAGFVLAEESVGPRYWERRTPWRQEKPSKRQGSEGSPSYGPGCLRACPIGTVLRRFEPLKSA